MENTVSILRHNYETEAEYKKAYRDAVKKYDFKVRVSGGWKFFAYVTDLDVWKKQK